MDCEAELICIACSDRYVKRQLPSTGQPGNSCEKVSLCCTFVVSFHSDTQPSNHTSQPSSKHSISPCSATLCKWHMKQMPRRS